MHNAYKPHKPANSDPSYCLHPMSTLKSMAAWFLVLLIICGAGVFVFTNYSWVFAKRVHGEILEMERVTNPTAILGRGSEELMHSYAVMIRGDDGKIYTASSEDRQWQVARKGYCVEALLYVYPPWNLSKGGTYYNARLDRVELCPGKTAPPDSPPVSTTPPTGQ